MGNEEMDWKWSLRIVNAAREFPIVTRSNVKSCDYSRVCTIVPPYVSERGIYDKDTAPRV